MESLADLAIDAIIETAPSHAIGTRPIHAPGIGATGRFWASDVASNFSDAAHFSGRAVPVTVRFSDGTGSLEEPDTNRLVRGMALRFHLGSPGVDGEGLPLAAVETDMVCMTLPVFFTSTVPNFMEFLDAVLAGSVPPMPWWRRAWRALQLNPVPVQPLGAREYGAIAYANEHPEARPAVVGLSGLSVPQSYVSCCYHAVHAYRLRVGDNVAAVRFRWEPIAGVRSAPKDTASPFLKEELRQRLRAGPAEFVLRMQIAEQGDDTSDPTRAWPESRRRVVMGHLRIETVLDDQDGGAERLRFDPTRVVDGVELSDDLVLLGRREVYARSAERRSGAAAGVTAVEGILP